MNFIRSSAKDSAARRPRSPSTRRLVLSAAVFATAASATLAATPAHAIDTGGANEVASAAGINASGLARFGRKAEQKIVECMKKEGFTYVSEADVFPADAQSGGSENREAFVKKYGYGVTTFIDANKKTAADTNQEFRAKLSKSA